MAISIRPSKETLDALHISTVAAQRVSRAYHLHHFACPTCIAAGMRYGQRCATGLPLWKAYQHTS